MKDGERRHPNQTIGIMFTSTRGLQALLFATGACALFPDCTNGPLKNETICDSSACKITFKRLQVQY
jgi:hypothetical protein